MGGIDADKGQRGIIDNKWRESRRGPFLIADWRRITIWMIRIIRFRSTRKKG